MGIISNIQKRFPEVEWQRIFNAGYDAIGFVGTFVGGDRIVVVQFSIEDQGFPPGSKGYDGAVTFIGGMIHLTRELAQEAFELALKKTQT